MGFKIHDASKDVAKKLDGVIGTETGTIKVALVVQKVTANYVVFAQDDADWPKFMTGMYVAKAYLSTMHGINVDALEEGFTLHLNMVAVIGVEELDAEESE